MLCTVTILAGHSQRNPQSVSNISSLIESCRATIIEINHSESGDTTLIIDTINHAQVEWMLWHAGYEERAIPVRTTHGNVTQAA